jgi:hypothetical protein
VSDALYLRRPTLAFSQLRPLSYPISRTSDILSCISRLLLCESSRWSSPSSVLLWSPLSTSYVVGSCPFVFPFPFMPFYRRLALSFQSTSYADRVCPHLLRSQSLESSDYDLPKRLSLSPGSSGRAEISIPRRIRELRRDQKTIQHQPYRSKQKLGTKDEAVEKHVRSRSAAKEGLQGPFLFLFCYARSSCSNGTFVMA